MSKKAFEFDNEEGGGFIQFEYSPSQKAKLEKHNDAIAVWSMWQMSGYIPLPNMDEVSHIDIDLLHDLQLMDEAYRFHKENKEKIKLNSNTSLVADADGDKSLLDQIIEAVGKVINYNHIDEMKFETVGDMLVTTQQFYIDMEKLETLYNKWQSGIDNTDLEV